MSSSKEYMRIYNAKYRLANPEKFKNRSTIYNKEYQDRYRLANKDRHKNHWKDYYAANKDRIKARSRAWYLNNKERAVETRRKYYKANTERMKAACRSYNARNKDKISTQCKAWKKANRDKINLSVQKLFKSNLNARILHRLRTRISIAFRTQATKKAHRTADLLGCSVPSFRIYIESKFEPGMTWENYGKEWHLDHIVPCAMFDLTKSEHQKACFHFSNYQPLFTKDNLVKGKKLFSDPGHLGL